VLNDQQSELVSSILDGAFETPLWSGFLAKLRTQTGADVATLVFRPPGRPLSEALHLFSGKRSLPPISDAYDRSFDTLELLQEFGIEPGQVWSFDQLFSHPTPRKTAFYDQVVKPSGAKAARMIRVMEPSGVSAWLTISRLSGDFCERDTALMRDLAPLLQGALRNYIALERERFVSDVTSKAMRQLYFGWMTLDDRGHVLEMDAEAQRALSESPALRRCPNGRLLATTRSLQRELTEAITAVAKNGSRASALTLSREPWLDMLLVPATQKRFSVHPRAAIIAYVHGDSWRSSDRCDQLRQLFGLSPSEARLALALSRGATITESAEKFGLAVDTVRKYTKTTYAKLGARGLPDLVRIVMRSVVIFAPER
jgi:DNA-binding CsgD family transcriptional regulator